MAIAFDAASSASSAGSAVSTTFSHTCTGSDLVLVVFVGWIQSTTQLVQSVTYNGVALTPITSAAANAAICQAFYLINPATGSNNVVVTMTAAAFHRGGSLSYTGANQISQPDGSNSSSVTDTSVTTTVTTTADSCWNISGIENGGALVTTASTGISSTRVSIPNVFYVGDSNGPKTPSGAYSMTWTSSSQDLAAVQISIAPKSANGKLALLGVG